MSRLWRRVVETLRRDFVAGLLVFVPVGFTILGILWLIEQLDRLVLPRVFRAVGMQADQPPLLGALVTLCVILLAGALTRSVIGRALIRLWEWMIDRIPVARSLYTVLKQFMQAVFGAETSQSNFRRVVLVQYPREGLWSYAFVTGRPEQPIAGLPEGLISVFVPSTPNPTTGYFLLVPERDTVPTGLSVETAFRLIISAGIAAPEEARKPEPRVVPEEARSRGAP